MKQNEFKVHVEQILLKNVAGNSTRVKTLTGIG